MIDENEIFVYFKFMNQFILSLEINFHSNFTIFNNLRNHIFWFIIKSYKK